MIAYMLALLFYIGMPEPPIRYTTPHHTIIHTTAPPPRRA